MAIGYFLDELENQITKNTSAYFEPALDYVIVKMPRWNFDKFKGANDTLGLQMKSVGEVMSIGRSFTEAVQKACQSLENNAVGLGYYGKSQMHAEELIEYLKTPKWDRIFRIKDALMLGVSVGTISKATNGIDRWFLNQIKLICDIEKEIAKYKLETLPLELLEKAKRHGFGDEQISKIMNDSNEDAVYEKRKAAGITRVFKMVDTCSAEFEAKTPYFYSTFEARSLTPPGRRANLLAANESKVSDKKKIIVLGSGPNRIGQGIEFDYCCVHGLLAIKECGYESIMVNCNPETVSTDFDMADKLILNQYIGNTSGKLLSMRNQKA